MKRSLIIGCPTPVRNSYPGSVFYFNFIVFAFRCPNAKKRWTPLFFVQKRGLALEKFQRGVRKLNPTSGEGMILPVLFNSKNKPNMERIVFLWYFTYLVNIVP